MKGCNNVHSGLLKGDIVCNLLLNIADLIYHPASIVVYCHNYYLHITYCTKEKENFFLSTPSCSSQL